MRHYRAQIHTTPAREGDPWHDKIAVDAAAWEFAEAIHRYQRRTGRRYPSWLEVFYVLLALGYRRPAKDPPGPS